MKLCKLMKDGGPLSRVWGFFVIEAKFLFSIVILRFMDGSREAYHSHAFDAVSWVIKGQLTEYVLNGPVVEYTPSLRPIFTSRARTHRVVSVGDTWVITFRGPWKNTWAEFLPNTGEHITLTHGRRVVAV